MINRRDAAVKATLSVIVYYNENNQGESLNCRQVKKYLQALIEMRDRQKEAEECNTEKKKAH